MKEEGSRAKKVSYRIIVEGTEEARLLDIYEEFDIEDRSRLFGYMEALKESANRYHLSRNKQ